MSNRQSHNIGLNLFLLFTVVPLVELILLVWLSRVISFPFTLGLILISGLVGASMARMQGIRVWRQAQRELSMGRFPADSLVDGLIILIGGALLITPGILTDIVGFSTLIPPARAVLRRAIKDSFKGRVRTVTRGAPGGGGFNVYTSTSQGAWPNPDQNTDSVTEPEKESEGTPFEDQSPFGKLKK